MKAQEAGQILLKTLRPSGNLTVADASTKSGLALRDAEVGLHYLVAEYRGQLAATQKGELLFRFPTGFSKPWESVEAIEHVWRRVKKFTLGVAKFVVRAWITIVMVTYVAIFAAILIGLTMAKSNDRDDRGSSFGGQMLFYTLWRVILDSLFWTFHPFSPFRVNYQPGYRKPAGLPFYEKVNRFFFGPELPTEDPLEVPRRVLAEIRAKKGRVGLADIMRVTGLPKEKTDPLMAKFMLDYNGDVEVSEQGGISYRFEEIRKTVQNERVIEPDAIWMRKEQLLPLTGNPAGSNLMITALNGFNLLMSSVAISGGWTVEKLQWMFTAGAQAKYLGVLPSMPVGTPLVLGWIPFWFSLALFAIPVWRILKRPAAKQKVNHENGRRGLLWAVLNRLTRQGIAEDTLKSAWKQNAGVEPGNRELTREVIKLGGELDINDAGLARYHFPDLELEAKAVEVERGRARDTEKEVGDVVFAS